MEQSNTPNKINVYTSLSTSELKVSTPDIKQVISATNNRAQYYAEQAKKYRDEAKAHRDNAKYYSEQNSDVTFEYIENVKLGLENKLELKQNIGDYALSSDIPTKVSAFENDALYVNKNELNSVVDELRLPEQEGNEGKFLQTISGDLSWEKIPSSYYLFDTKLSDHILTYEESKGWALQGTYVYKDAIAGSRYGYPDFYAKCLEEYENSSNAKQWLKSNINKVGSIVDDNGVLSGFSTANYVYPNTTSSFASVASTANSWVEVFKIRLNSTSVRNSIVGGNSGTYTHDLYINANGILTIALSSNGSSYNIANDVVGKTALTVNTDYWIKLEFTGTQYIASYSIDGINFETEITVSSTTKIENTTDISYIGCRGDMGSPINGSIDLKESYIDINGSRWWSGVETYNLYKNSNGHLFYNISEKDKIDEAFSLYGTAWFYGVDTENERIYLPRNNYFEQTTGEISEVGRGVTAGLPNITGWTNGEETDAGGAFYHEKALTGGCNNGSNKYEKINFDASLSNLIYGNSDTVQPNAVKKLLYICVGNTETVSSITDVVDVTTAENDITPLFTGMYFDFTPNNVSWLKAGQQANSAGIYTTCYNELVNVLNGEIKYGDLKVVDTADMIAGVDYSEYWKVNQDDMTFTTPTAISNKALSGAVKGNGMTLGLTNGSEYGGLRLGTTNNTALIDTSLYGTQVGTSESTSSSLTRDISIGVTTDPTKSGIIAEQSIAQLYFKVANAVQNLELLNAGEVMEAVADKISRQDCKAYIQETYQNGTSWYRVYSDGWCEQGGNFQNATKISYIKQFKDINYILSVNPHWNNNNAVYWCDLGYAKTTTDFSIKQQTNTALTYDWQASGYIA